jgi:hypothetical protein
MSLTPKPVTPPENSVFLQAYRKHTAVDVLRGSKPNAAEGSIAEILIEKEGAFLQVAVPDVNDIVGEEPKVPLMVKQIKRLALVIGQDHEDIYVDAKLKAHSQEAAESIKVFLDGAIAAAPLAGKGQKKLAELAQKVKVSTEQNAVHVHFRADAEALLQFMEQPKQATQKKGKQAKPPEPTHDVAVTDISAPSSCTKGDTVSVTVNIENLGDYDESLDVELIDVTGVKEITSHPTGLSARNQDGNDVEVTFTGETGGRQGFGSCIAVGDTNGDEYDDLLVSATRWNKGQGRAYLYYGGENMDAIPDRTFSGENSGDCFTDNGVYLADMNNDGFDDVIIGARFFNNRGRVYIYWGGTDMDEKADITIEAEEGVTDSSFGRGIGAGDLNGDGYMDLLVSAVKYKSFTGRTYLYFGPIASDSVADKVFTGENVDDTFGEKIATGDVDGDHCDDLLLGTRYYPRNTGKGRVYLYYGGPGTSMDEICDLCFDAENPDDNFGCDVELFDIDNDGFADAIISARRWPAGRLRGRVYLYWGSSRTTMDNEADLMFDGEINARECFGGTCVMGGYFNNDDYGDIIVAAYGYHQLSYQGRAYLFYGKTKTTMDTVYDHTFTPEETDNGPHRTRMGDFNGDGYGDVIMGGFRYNNFQGRCWLWLGPFPSSSIDVTFNWDTTDASIGKHTLKVEIPPVPGEQNIEDNVKTVTIEVKGRQNK